PGGQLMPHEATSLPTPVQVVEAYGPIRASGERTETVDGEGDAIDALSMARKASLLLPAARVPEADGLVLAAGQDAMPVGGEGHGPDDPGVPPESPDELPRSDVPELEVEIVRSTPSGRDAAREGSPAVGSEGDARDGLIVGGQRPDL